jgi:hypothetical protein
MFCFLPQRKSFINETGTHQGHVQKGLPRVSVAYMKHCGISCPRVSYSINFFSYEDSRKLTRGTL